MKAATPARTVREFKALMQTDPSEVKFVRSLDDWKAFVRNGNGNGNPLKRLTEADIREFTKDLFFNNGGIAGANLRILQEKLTYVEYKDVLAAFGMDVVFAEDHQGYACVGVGDCATNQTHICTSNC
jgi:hypothetical protein